MTGLARTLLVAISITFAVIQPAAAEHLVNGISAKEVAIDPAFSGQKLTLFGNIEPDRGETALPTTIPYQVIIVIRGPSNDRVVRRKAHNYGIWINTNARVYRNFPSYYWVLSSAGISEITDSATLKEARIPAEIQPTLVETDGSGDREIFDAELLDLMQSSEYFGSDPQAVVFQSDTLYAAQVTLPADVPNGNYLAETYIFNAGKIVATKAERFSVRTIGFERFIATSARLNPLIYGLTCIALAFLTGWFGGVIFKR